MRDVNFNDPSSWDEDDKVWLRQRIDRVPPEHREHLEVRPVASPANEAESVELDRLRAFLMANFPDEMAGALATDTPVGVAIRLLSDEYETTEADDESAVDDTYDSWKVAELQEEINKRNEGGASLSPASNRKDDLVSALRGDDASKA
jgi:hypothetical protein